MPVDLNSLSLPQAAGGRLSGGNCFLRSRRFLPRSPFGGKALATGAAILALAGSSFAQVVPTPINPWRLDEMVVTATRVEEPSGDLPYATAALDRARLDSRSFRTMPDALREESSVMVQKTALG